MQKKVIIIQSQPSMTRMFEDVRRTKAAEEAFLQQFVRDAADVDILVDATHRAASAPDEADYIDEIPEIMGRLYAYALHFNSVRHQLINPAGPLYRLQKLLPDVCQLGEIIEGLLDILEELYDRHVGLDGEDKDEEDEKEESGEMDADVLCEVSIRYAADVPEQTKDCIVAGIRGVLEAQLGEDENDCDGCLCGGHCYQAD